jgi:hypothetical protein
VSVTAASRYADCEEDDAAGHVPSGRHRRASIEAEEAGDGAAAAAGLQAGDVGVAPLLNTLGSLPLDDVLEVEDEGRSSRASSLRSTRLGPAIASGAGKPPPSVAGTSAAAARLAFWFYFVCHAVGSQH